MKEKLRKVFKDKWDIVAIVVLIALFGYFAIFKETLEYNDSYQHLNQFISREPVYALILQFFTTFLGFENYHFALGLFQNGLAIVCTYWLYGKIRDIFHFNPFLRLTSLGILLSPHIMTPISAKSGMIITNSVLTEGIAISLYYVWFGVLLCCLLDEKKQTKKQMLLSLFLSLIMSMIRGQLLICIIVWLIVVITGEVKKRFVASKREEKSATKKKWLIKCLVYILVAGITFIARGQIIKIYNYLESGLYVNTVSSKPMLLANAIYVADPEDAKYIEDDGLKKTFEQIISGTKEEGLLISNATGSIIDRAKFHEYGHEMINFDQIIPALNDYILVKDGLDADNYFEKLIVQDKYAMDIFKAILPGILPEFMKNYFVIASLGFVRSVAIEKSILPWFALMMYILSFIMIILLLKKDKGSKGAYFMLLILLLICGTVFGTSIMIECISRYMIYNLPLFYIAMLAMSKELIYKMKWR